MLDRTASGGGVLDFSPSWSADRGRPAPRATDSVSGPSEVQAPMLDKTAHGGAIVFSLPTILRLTACPPAASVGIGSVLHARATGRAVRG